MERGFDGKDDPARKQEVDEVEKTTRQEVQLLKKWTSKRPFLVGFVQQSGVYDRFPTNSVEKAGYESGQGAFSCRMDVVYSSVRDE